MVNPMEKNMKDQGKDIAKSSGSAGEGRKWLSFVLTGALLMAFGIGAVLAPAVSNVATSTVFGLLLALAGVTCVVQALMVKETRVVGGIFIMLSPLKGAAAITLILAIVIGGLGLTQAGLALRLRPAAGWGWLMLASFASLLIAVVLVLRFPFSVTEYPGVMAGISLIFGGLAYVMLGLARRKSMPKVTP
jgi:uncharacterized membrane protein HdeD (DUF308 family)